jgi:hypothetical protein
VGDKDDEAPAAWLDGTNKGGEQEESKNGAEGPKGERVISAPIEHFKWLCH